MKEEIPTKGRLLRNPRYMLFAVSGAVTRVGDSIDMVLFGLMAYQITGSAATIALIYGANRLPNIFLQPFCGPLVEHTNKKTVQSLGLMGRGLMVITVAWLYHKGYLMTTHLFLVTIFNSVMECFTEPAAAGLLPRLIDREQYAAGQSMYQTAVRICEMAGLAAAGAMVMAIDISASLLVDAAAFLAGSVLLLPIRTGEEIAGTEKMSPRMYFNDLSGGMKYLGTQPVVLMLCLLGTAINALLTPINSLVVPLVTDALRLDAAALSLSQMFQSMGIMAGGALFPFIPKKHRNWRIFCACGVAAGVFFAMLGLLTAADPHVIIKLHTFNFLFGLCMGETLIQMNVTMMEVVELRYKSRVSSLSGALAMAAIPVSNFILSGVCMVVRTEVIFTLFGSMMAVLFMVSALSSTMRRL